MPVACTLESLPEPIDSTVTVRQIPARRTAAPRCFGSRSERRFLRHGTKPGSWVRRRGFGTAGAGVT